jgi:uncharacterized membrane protein
MEQQRTLQDNIFLFLKGLAMGAANKVPGVSGGIVAFVGGFYEEFIYALKKVNKKAFFLLVSGRFKSFYYYINGPFIWVLLMGMIVSYFSVSKALDYFLLTQETYVWSLFFGMILGSVYYISKQFKQWNSSTILWGFIGLGIGVSISFLSPAKENDHLLFVFFCGMISVSGMTLPGLSGSFILMLLGNYVLLLVDSVNALYDTFFEIIQGDFSFWNNPKRLKTLKILAVFTLGSTAGLVTLSHLISIVLKRFNAISTAIIIGFISGSLGVVWPWKETIYKLNELGKPLLDSNQHKIILNYQRYIPSIQEAATWWAIFWMGLGFVILMALESYAHKKKQ